MQVFGGKLGHKCCSLWQQVKEGFAEEMQPEHSLIVCRAQQDFPNSLWLTDAPERNTTLYPGV